MWRLPDIHRRYCNGSLWLGSVCLWLMSMAAGADVDVRLKWFGTASAFPAHDLQRELDTTPAYDHNADLRLMWEGRRDGLSLEVHHAITYVSGDSFAFAISPGIALEQSPGDDARRVMDLSWNVASGKSRRLFQRFDRLALKYRTGNWGFTLGRQAVSWGSGLVFQPMDLFNPFAPTTVDRDYKAGDDLLLIERLFGNGSDLQLLAVGRRDEQGDFSGSASSIAAKWHGFLADGEIELLAARHANDQVYGFTLRWPLGGALARSDLVVTRLNGGNWELSAVVNIDYSLQIAGHTSYVYAEYFHSDFGVDKLPDTPAMLPASLTARVERGELFNLMRDYLALGGSIEWHPLWNQSLTVIANLGDGSTLVQSQMTFEPGDHQRLQFGVVVPVGSAGEEFGGVPVLPTTNGPLTSGGGLRGYLRWVYYL